MNGLDKQDEIRAEINTTETTADSDILAPESNTQHQLKRYSRTLSETNVGYRPVSNNAKLKRVLSATELKTRLAGCPKGLLITTEPPKSGETYRRRSNTDVKAIIRIKEKSLYDESHSDIYQETIHWKQVNN
jgi:hypothetical protein